MDKKNGLTLPKMLFKSSFIYNPVLTQAIGTCTVVAICFTLKISLIVSLNLAIILIVNEVLASLVLKKLSRWMRIICYMLLSTFLLVPIMLLLDNSYSQLNASMGIYLPLLAVNSLVVIRCEKYAVKNPVKLSLFDALSASLGYTVVAVIIGALREIIAYGTLLDKEVTSMPNYSGIALPFGGLIVLGFLAAFHKWIIRTFFKNQPTNTFSLKTVFDTPLIREEGLYITSGTLSILNDPAVTKEESLSQQPKNGTDTENKTVADEISVSSEQEAEIKSDDAEKAKEKDGDDQ